MIIFAPYVKTVGYALTIFEIIGFLKLETFYKGSEGYDMGRYGIGSIFPC